ncbi:hypothetical protein EHW64_19600 [Erwinia psidii]|uniref:hypothetical protein n=1 Tax=Erwinia psidii TaxID=69224 RepID=UPI00226B14D1|nr:hypothetical protein [Erwinia psidii]MCX8958313.1 hypothetical protein [Erwinia psidii]MCX8963256.1 hypothetical protein [Erwinia psidii]
MAKAWKEVISSSQYQQLSPAQQSEAQKQYFNEVVAPRAGDKAAEAKAAFFAAYPLAQEQPQPDNPLLEAGKGVAQAAVNIANIPSSIGDMIYDADAWIASKLQGKEVQPSKMPRFELPESLQPKDEYAKIGAEMGPYLIPGVGPGRTAAALGSVAGAGRAERYATKAADMLAENTVGALAQNSGKYDAEGLVKDLAVGTAASGTGRVVMPLLGKAAGAVKRSLTPADRVIPTTNDEIVQAAKSRAGREDLNRAINQVSPDVDEAARVTGVDINALSPGQRSGNAGLQDVEGVLSSVAGPARDAQDRGISAVTNSLKNDLNRLGAEAGSSSEKTAAIRERVVNSLNSLKASERSAWESMRNVANPLAKEKAANVRAHLNAEKALATFDNTTLKSLHKTTENPMTFEQMKEWRSRIGDSEEAARRAGKLNEARKLAGARNALADDMRGMAEKHGFIDDWEKANGLSRERFAMEKDAKTAFGKSLDSDQFVSKLNTALRSSAEKGVSPVHKLVAALPESERGVMLASALSRAVEKGSRGGETVGAGMKNLSEILTPQNLAAVRRYLPQEADLLAAYGTLARSASGFLKRMEHTGRSMPSLKRLEEGIGGMTGAVLRASANRGLDLAIGGAAVATGGVGGAAVAGGKFLASQLLERAIEKRSVKFIVEKAIQEGGNALKAGGSKAAVDAAEKRLLRDPRILAILNKEFSPEEVRAIRRMGIVMSVIGLEAWQVN